MSVCFHYQFHAVGQGLFASGCLYEPNRIQPRFLWVYDCGSTRTKASFWQDQISGLKEFARGRQLIELLTISHFDNDHISGVAELLGRFEVEVLLLPFVPLHRRIEVAFQQGMSSEDPRFGFYANPAQFLQGLPRANIQRIVIVMPSDEPPLRTPNWAEPYPPDQDGEEPALPWRVFLSTMTGDAVDGLQFEFGSDVEFLDGRHPILVEGLWEFVPYNALVKSPPNAGFKAKVELLRDLLLEGDSSARQAALEELKAHYEATFETSKTKNEISLSLYAGPICRSWKAWRLLSGNTGPSFPSRYPCYRRLHCDAPSRTKKASILYTGDGYLDRARKFDQLAKFFGWERMDCVGVFQVNHHGAKENWHAGLASKIKSAYSVVSSDPTTKGGRHPAEAVKADYMPFGFTQVDKSNAAAFCGWMIPKSTEADE